jgi:hypothetical protein
VERAITLKRALVARNIRILWIDLRSNYFYNYFYNRNNNTPVLGGGFFVFGGEGYY